MDEHRKIVFLTGFMGAGKSTVGHVLAEKLRCEFIDLDALIVKREQKSIADIFAKDGEKYFRDCETDTLKSLEHGHAAVVATGGGLVVRQVNRLQMRNLGTIVYLKADWPALKARLLNSTERPLVDPQKGWGEVEALWAERQACYEDSDIIIDTDKLHPEEIAQAIVTRLAGQ